MMMTERMRKFIRGGISLTAVALLMRTVGVSFNAYVSTTVGAAGMGLYGLMMTVYSFAVTFATSGVNLAATRLVSEAMGRGDPAEAGRAMRRCLIYAALFGGTASLILAVGAPYFGGHVLGDSRSIPGLRVLSLCLLPISLSSAMNGYFLALRRAGRNAMTQLFEQGVRIAVTFCALRAFNISDLSYACLALVGGAAISEFSSFFVLLAQYLLVRRRQARTVPRVGGELPGPRGGFARLLHISLPVAFSAYFRAALLTAEHLLIPYCIALGGASRTEALSSYGILQSMAIPVILYPMAVLSSFAGLLVPELSEDAAAGKQSHIRSVAGRAVHITLLFSIGIGGLMLIFAPELGSLIYHSAEAGRYIAMLAPVIPIMYLDHVVDAMLKGVGEQVYSMFINIGDSLLSIALVRALLPSFGAAGYVAVIIAAEIFNFSLSITRLHDAVHFRLRITRSVLLPLGAVILAATAMRLLLPAAVVPSPGGLCCRVLFTAPVYALLLFAGERLLYPKQKTARASFCPPPLDSARAEEYNK